MTLMPVYVIFAISLFIVKGLWYHLVAGMTVSAFLLFLPFKKIKSGIFPITVFIIFTFAGNLFFHHGRIVYEIGFLTITDEGLLISGVRTLRVFSMVFGAKVLTHFVPMDELIHSMNRFLGPLEKTGLPVKDFFHIMGLTMKTFPVLIDRLSGIYREEIRNREGVGFAVRIRNMAVFLMPLFVQGISNPDSFFQEEDNGKSY